MLRLLRRAMVVLLAAWAAVSALLGLFLYRWLRERYGRGGPFPAAQALALLNPARSWLHPVEPTLRRFRIREGDTVLELGPGPGYFSAGAASLAGPSGRVVGVDIQPAMARTLRRRLEEQGTRTAHPVAGDAARLPLRDACVDTAFLVAVLGEVPDRPAAIRELRRVLKPGGVLSIMEMLNDPDYQLEASVRDLCRALGFDELELTRQRLGYTLCFTRAGRA